MGCGCTSTKETPPEPELALTFQVSARQKAEAKIAKVEAMLAQAGDGESQELLAALQADREVFTQFVVDQRRKKVLRTGLVTWTVESGGQRYPFTATLRGLLALMQRKVPVRGTPQDDTQDLEEALLDLDPGETLHLLNLEVRRLPSLKLPPGSGLKLSKADAETVIERFGLKDDPTTALPVAAWTLDALADQAGLFERLRTTRTAMAMAPSDDPEERTVVTRDDRAVYYVAAVPEGAAVPSGAASPPPPPPPGEAPSPGSKARRPRGAAAEEDAVTPQKDKVMADHAEQVLQEILPRYQLQPAAVVL